MELTATKYEQTEVGLIPQGWEIKELGQLAKVIGGGTPKTTVAGYWNGKISWFTPTEVGKQKYLITSNRKITLEGLHSSSAQILPIGTILLTSRAGIGDLGILTKEAATNQGFQSLLVFDEYDNEYVYYLLSTLKPKLLSRASGSTFLEISPSKVKEIRVGVPSTLTEQKAIAQVLSDTDALIQALEKKIAKKKLIKKGVMQKLLTPKKGWSLKKLGNLCETITTGKLDANAMVKDGAFRFYTCAKEYYYIDNYSFDTEALLVSGNGANVGYIHYYKGKFNAYQRTYVLSGFKQNILFIKQFMDKYLKIRIDEQKNDGNTPYIKMDTLTEMEIYYPPIEEQKQIVHILSGIDKEIAQLVQKLSKYQLVKQGMMQQLLTGKIRLV